MNLALFTILTFFSMGCKAKVLNEAEDSILKKNVPQSENHELHFINNNSYSQNEEKQLHASCNRTAANKDTMPQLLRNSSSNLNITGRTSITYRPNMTGKELLLHFLRKRNIKRKVKAAQYTTTNGTLILGEEHKIYSKKVMGRRQTKEVFANETIKEFSVKNKSISYNSTVLRTQNFTHNPVHNYMKSSRKHSKSTNFVLSILTKKDVPKNYQKISYDDGGLWPTVNNSNFTMKAGFVQHSKTEVKRKDRQLLPITLNHTTDGSQKNVNKIDNRKEMLLYSSDINDSSETDTLQRLMHRKDLLTSLEEKLEEGLSAINLTKEVDTVLYGVETSGKAMQYYEEVSLTNNSSELKEDAPSQDSTISKLVAQDGEPSAGKTEAFMNAIVRQLEPTQFFDDGYSCHKQKRSLFGSEETLHCPPCEQIHCYKQKRRRLQCRGGYTLDICGCCRVCAKLEGEQCGGQHDYLGKCDRNLFCDPQPPAVVTFFREGIKKVYKVHRGICKKVVAKFETDNGRVRSSCKPKCEPEFCMKNPRAICSAKNVAETMHSCQGSCQHTSCRACRFVQPDIRCPKCLANDFRCLREFGRYIRKDSCKSKSYPCGNQLPVKHDGDVFLCKVPECDISN